MPSRLPPGLSTGGQNNSTQTTPLPIGSHLNSDTYSQSQAFGPSTRLNGIAAPSFPNTMLSRQQQLNQATHEGEPFFQQNSSSASLPVGISQAEFNNPSHDLYRNEIPFGAMPPQNYISQPQQQALNPSVSRLRSGSLSVLPDNRSSLYSSPLGSSIWSSKRTSHYHSPGTNDSKRTSQSSLLSAYDDTSSTVPSSPFSGDIYSQTGSSGVPFEGLPMDPMQPFYKDLALRTDPSRMRSYTVNNLPHGPPLYNMANSEPSSDFAEQAEQHQRFLLQNQQHLYTQPAQFSRTHSLSDTQRNFHSGNRARAQTTAGSLDPPFPTQGNMLYNGELSAQHTQSAAQSTSLDYFPKRVIISSFDDPSLGMSCAVWVQNIPASTTSYALTSILSSFGTVESARVFPDKNCGYANFLNTTDATQAKSALDGRELFVGQGPCRVGYAKIVEASELILARHPDDQLSSSSPASLPAKDAKTSGYLEQTDSPLHRAESNASNKDTLSGNFKNDLAQPLGDLSSEIKATIEALGTTPDGVARIMACVGRAVAFDDFKKELPPVPEPRSDRVYDAPTLREVRKKIDSGNCSQQEIEEIALNLLDEIAELSSDYVGNTVVQKLFNTCSEPVKDIMLEHIAPYLSQISVHKNGTWAAQKIIGVANSPRQMEIIAQALHPYAVHLFLDQFGNYAVQCCLKFGSSWNDFIFETMLAKFWEIAQSRFGSRAMRACLESSHVTPEHQRMIAAAITMHTVQLATNANGALMLTWYLDTYTVNNRHSILASKLIPNLTRLCTHKLASLTVLKVINHKAEPGARQEIFNALFNPHDDGPNRTLEQILNHTYGPTFIYKVLSLPLLEGPERNNAVEKIRSVLVTMKVLPGQVYKRLMDEVGLTAHNTNNQPLAPGQQPVLSRQNSMNSSPPLYNNAQSASASTRTALSPQQPNGIRASGNPNVSPLKKSQSQIAGQNSGHDKFRAKGIEEPGRANIGDENSSSTSLNNFNGTTSEYQHHRSSFAHPPGLHDLAPRLDQLSLNSDGPLLHSLSHTERGPLWSQPPSRHGYVDNFRGPQNMNANRPMHETFLQQP